MTKKWFVVKADGETSGGFFATEENARKHLELARQIFPDIAREFRVASGQVTLDAEEGESNERDKKSDGPPA